jgi:hypothetical protein
MLKVMSQEHVRLSFLVLLPVCFCVIQGCQKPAVSPPREAGAATQVGPVEPADGENPTPEEARSALIQLVKTFDFKKVYLSKEIADALKSKKTLDELKNAKIYHETHRHGELTKIGSWNCKLSEKRFSKHLITTNTYSMDLEGRFEAGADSRWKAVPEGPSIADFPDKSQTPRDRR